MVYRSRWFSETTISNLYSFFKCYQRNNQFHLKGVIDILRDRAIYFDGPCGEIIRYDEVPAEHRAQRKDAHHELVEHLVRVVLQLQT